MDKLEFTLEDAKNTIKEGHTQSQGAIRREMDSLDDFEHLGHDASPLKEKLNEQSGDLLSSLNTDPFARDVQSLINTGVEKAATAVNKITDDLSTLNPKAVKEQIHDKSSKMDSNLFEMGDHFPDRKEADDKLDKFLQEMGPFSTPKHQEIPENLHKDSHLDGFKSATQDFMDIERKFNEPKSTSNTELLDRYSDSEPEDNVDDFKPSKYEDFPKKAELPESFGSNDNFKAESFKDVHDFETTPPKKDLISEVAKPTAPFHIETSQFEPIQPVKIPEPVKQVLPEPPKPTVPEVVIKEKVPEKISEPSKPAQVEIKKSDETKPKKAAAIEAEAIFCKMGLDAWFNPERLNPQVESLIYWRDPKKSGPVFAGVLVVLLALTYFSLISVVAYLSLLGLTGTILFRIYKNIVQAVQKTGDGHPFKEYLEWDVSLSQDKVKEVTEIAVAHLNAGVGELRRLFLVEDLVDSIKFGVLLWTLTYLGAWFNGMTLIIIAWVALFSLPKVYETNKTQIDANLEIVRTKLAEITSKVKAAIPIGKKTEEKKEQ